MATIYVTTFSGKDEFESIEPTLNSFAQTIHQASLTERFTRDDYGDDVAVIYARNKLAVARRVYRPADGSCANCGGW
ncbi:hypothetical protein [Mycobacterium leprae]|uniref:hypothetical protein n=1 Tax=Mycobacterium leprae TaxID=1769 RepID=UPI0006742A59|nr:hypothetical protein [Mycobacterium leprae]